MADTAATRDQMGRLGVWFHTETKDHGAAAEFACRLEDLGYGTLWLPETVGRDPFAHIAFLATQATKLNFATGIANIHHRHPGMMKQAQYTLAEQTEGRFILGVGVSHAPMVAGLRKLTYDKPLSQMRQYLEAMDQSFYAAVGPKDEPPRVVAALGPKMLELSKTNADGAHPYWTTPEHTAQASEILGADKLLCVEQKIVLETDADKARTAARNALAVYAKLPNYRNNWLRLGFSESDVDDDGGSDKLIDTLVAWGTADDIKKRVDEHFAAGATHVCIQPLSTDPTPGALDWNALEALKP